MYHQTPSPVQQQTSSTNPSSSNVSGPNSAPNGNFLFTNTISNSSSTPSLQSIIPPQQQQQQQIPSSSNTTASQQQQQQQQHSEDSSSPTEFDSKDKKDKAKKSRSKKPKKTTVTNNKEVIIRKHRKNITLEDIAQCFEMPIRDASQILGISLTQLKRLCREYNISRWPYRRLNSIQRRIDVLVIMLKRCEESGDAKCYHQTLEEKEKLEEEVKTIKNDPKYLCSGSSSFGDSSDEDDDELQSRGKKRGISPPQHAVPQVHIQQQQQPQITHQQISHQQIQHQPIPHQMPSHQHTPSPPNSGIASPPVKVVAHNNNSGKSKLIINQNRYSPYPTAMSISPNTPTGTATTNLSSTQQNEFTSMQSMFAYAPQQTLHHQDQQQQQHHATNPVDSMTSLMSIDPNVNPNITGANRRIVVKMEQPAQEPLMKRRNAHDHSNLVDMMRSDAPMNSSGSGLSQHSYGFQPGLQQQQQHQQQQTQQLPSAIVDLSCRRLSKQMESLKFLDSDRKADMMGGDNLSLSLDSSGFSDEWSMYTPSYNSPSNQSQHNNNATGNHSTPTNQEWIFNNSYQPNNNFYQYNKTK